MVRGRPQRLREQAISWAQWCQRISVSGVFGGKSVSDYSFMGHREGFFWRQAV